MDTHLKHRPLALLWFAGATLCGDANAELAAKTSDAAQAPQRETSVGVGYAILAPFKMPTGYDAAGTPLSSASFAGYSIEVTRRFRPQLECGFLAWLSSSSSDGKGSYAHALSRAFGGELRFLPWGFTSVEPLDRWRARARPADDYASWDATAQSDAHAVSATRLGHFEELDAGARFRLRSGFAVGARGGLSLLGFSKASVEHESGDTSGVYLIHPTDYRTRAWYSVMLTAELTVAD